MSDRDPYNLNQVLVRRLCYVVTEKLVRQVIRHWQTLPPGIESGNGLKNLWEEACVHIRSESSLSDLYRDELLKTLSLKVGMLEFHELSALWLQTYDGECYAEGPRSWSEEPGVISTGDAAKETSPSKNITDWPVDRKAVARRIVDDELMYECWNYQNSRIRAFCD